GCLKKEQMVVSAIASTPQVIPMNVQNIEPTILRATGSIHPLDVNFINEEDLGTPWEGKKSSGNRLNISIAEPLKI
ncbi:hypothetical protein IAI16_33555, partial [Escherichia coli]|nr:hypothetical protein [Escherichia coli]